MKDKGTLTVLLVTYNHEKYIEKSLKSILDQKIDIEFDIMVADDASTDNTLRLIRNMEQMHSTVQFNYLDHSVNLGITNNYKRAFSACKSEYIAIMEGDDYWVTPLKLSKQVDFLESHWECEMCATNYFVLEESRCHYYPRTPPVPGFKCLTSHDLIADNLIGNFSTCMYRIAALRKLPSSLFDIKSYDWITNICVGMHGMLGFINEPMSVYRLHAGGTWSAMSTNEQMNSQLEIIVPYDKASDYIFHDSFEMLSNRIKQQMIPEEFTLDRPALETNAMKSRARLIIDMVPPVLIILLKYILPPLLIRKLVSFWSRRAS